MIIEGMRRRWLEENLQRTDEDARPMQRTSLEIDPEIYCVTIEPNDIYNWWCTSICRQRDKVQFRQIPLLPEKVQDMSLSLNLHK